MGVRPARLRLLHTSDVHVGQWATDDVEREVHVLRVVVDRANLEAVDLLIVAGDLFDNNRVSQAIADAAAAALERLDMPAVVLPGNHDPLDESSVYGRMRLPSSVHVFRDAAGSTVAYPDLDLEVWGRAHTSYFDDVSPLRDIPPRGTARWQVAVAHGHYVEQHDPWRSYLISADELESADRDYVALGHWDVPRSVGPTGVAWYSGSPTRQGVGALVTLDDGPLPGSTPLRVEHIAFETAPGTDG